MKQCNDIHEYYIHSMIGMDVIFDMKGNHRVG